MFRYIIKRLIRGAVALLLFQTLLFALIHALPYDFTSFFLATSQFRHMLREILGLDLPVWQQYLIWLGRFLRLDLGVSFMFWPTPVSTILLARLPRTLLLFATGAMLAYLLGIWLGKLAAWQRGGLFEFGLTVAGVASYTSFAPWLAFLLLNVFGWYLGWLPYQRLVDPNLWFNAPVTVDGLLVRMIVTAVLSGAVVTLLWRITRRLLSHWWRRTCRLGGLAALAITIWLVWSRSGLDHLALDILTHLSLPLGTVVLLSFGETMMLMRTSMLEAMGEDYVLMARAKGLPDHTVRDRHVARNALLPVLTRLTLNLPFVLLGSLVIERIFMWHAMGQVIFLAIDYQDIPLLLGIMSVVGGLTLIAHILLDIVYMFLDPRIRYAREEGGRA